MCGRSIRREHKVSKLDSIVCKGISIYLIILSLCICIPALATEPESSLSETAQTQKQIEGKVQIDETSPKQEEQASEPNEGNTRQRSAASKSQNSSGQTLEPIEDVQSQTLRDKSPLQGSVRHSSLFARLRKPKLSSEDIRKLNYGVIGLVAYSKILIPTLPVISTLFPSCPAAEAGVRPGDVMIKAGDYTFHRGDSQKEVWQALGGRAGTKIDLVVKRKRELITFHMQRMNIEDIPNKRIRHLFESILQQYGPPEREGANSPQQAP